jgi:hypothetical protein
LMQRKTAIDSQYPPSIANAADLKFLH